MPLGLLLGDQGGLEHALGGRAVADAKAGAGRPVILFDGWVNWSGLATAIAGLSVELGKVADRLVKSQAIDVP